MSVSVGIPRALHYHEFGGLWQNFFEYLQVSVKISDQTTRHILDRGTVLAVDESCLPLKLYLGHAESLLGQCSHLFVPRIATYHHGHFFCAKFAGLPDIVRNTFELPASRIIAPNVDSSRAGRFGSAVTAARAVGCSALTGLRGLRQALPAWQKKAPADASPVTATKIAVIGHSYILGDAFLAADIFASLASQGLAAVTPDHLSAQMLFAEASHFAGDVYWQLSSRLAGATRHFVRRPDIAGIILVSCFGCGFDALMNAYLEHRLLKAAGKPYLILSLDEHTGQAGVLTRLEAFGDLLQRRTWP